MTAMENSRNEGWSGLRVATEMSELASERRGSWCSEKARPGCSSVFIATEGVVERTASAIAWGDGRALPATQYHRSYAAAPPDVVRLPGSPATCPRLPASCG